MEDLIYYAFCAMAMLGALGVLMVRGYVNATMSMLLSMLGVAGLMILMKAYFLGILMVSVYAGAVLVLFVFVVMLIGDRNEQPSLLKKIALLVLWVLAGAVVAFLYPTWQSTLRSSLPKNVLSLAKNYGYSLFTTFMLPVQVAERYCWLRW
ncbi:MAG: NADH-quinone oxidoreductase subunit J [Bacilli bacterium]